MNLRLFNEFSIAPRSLQFNQDLAREYNIVTGASNKVEIHVPYSIRSYLVATGLMIHADMFFDENRAKNAVQGKIIVKTSPQIPNLHISLSEVIARFRQNNSYIQNDQQEHIYSVIQRFDQEDPNSNYFWVIDQENYTCIDGQDVSEYNSTKFYLKIPYKYKKSRILYLIIQMFDFFNSKLNNQYSMEHPDGNIGQSLQNVSPTEDETDDSFGKHDPISDDEVPFSNMDKSVFADRQNNGNNENNEENQSDSESDEDYQQEIENSKATSIKSL